MVAAAEVTHSNCLFHLLMFFCACGRVSSNCKCGCPMHIQFNEIRSKNSGNSSYAKDQTNLFSFSSQSHCQKSNWFLISVCPQSNIWPKKKRLFFNCNHNDFDLHLGRVRRNRKAENSQCVKKTTITTQTVNFRLVFRCESKILLFLVSLRRFILCARCAVYLNNNKLNLILAIFYYFFLSFVSLRPKFQCANVFLMHCCVAKRQDRP